GSVADITITDLTKSYRLNVSSFLSKGKNSPFDGFELRGAIRYTIVDGRLVYSADKIH
ncbi:MAG: dihydroorotase, partial [Clostridiales bacterium]|nr:dihydroorotase [Clostridiales bacterium]